MFIRHIKTSRHQVSVDLHGIVEGEALTRQAVRRVTQGWRSRIRERGRLSERKRDFAEVHGLYTLTLGSIRGGRNVK